MEAQSGPDKNPNRIFPGNVIVLDRASGGSLALGAAVKLSPQVIAEPLSDEAIPAIPPNVIEPFLVQPLVVEVDGMNKAPRIVATEESRVYLGPGGNAYVSGLSDSKQLNWQIYRPGAALVDPDSWRGSRSAEASQVDPRKRQPGGKITGNQPHDPVFPDGSAAEAALNPSCISTISA